MQKMHSPRNLTGGLLPCGSKISYQNVSLAKSLMCSKERSVIARRNNHAKSVALKMNSLLNNSSHFDQRNLSTTIDGTNASVNHQFTTSEDVDPAE